MKRSLCGTACDEALSLFFVADCKSQGTGKAARVSTMVSVADVNEGNDMAAEDVREAAAAQERMADRCSGTLRQLLLQVDLCERNATACVRMCGGGRGIQYHGRWSASDMECPSKWHLVSTYHTVWPGSRSAGYQTGGFDCNRGGLDLQEQPQAALNAALHSNTQAITFVAAAISWACSSWVRVARVVIL